MLCTNSKGILFISLSRGGASSIQEGQPRKLSNDFGPGSGHDNGPASFHTNDDVAGSHRSTPSCGEHNCPDPTSANHAPALSARQKSRRIPARQRSALRQLWPAGPGGAMPAARPEPSELSSRSGENGHSSCGMCRGPPSKPDKKHSGVTSGESWPGVGRRSADLDQSWSQRVYRGQMLPMLTRVRPEFAKSRPHRGQGW